MEYFPPKSFLDLGKGSHHKNSRKGSFSIKPIEDNYSTDVVFLSIKYENGHYVATCWAFPKRQSGYMQSECEFYKTSPPFKTEEESVRWLEFQMIVLAGAQMFKKHDKMRKEIEDDEQWYRNLVPEVTPEVTL